LHTCLPSIHAEEMQRKSYLQSSLPLLGSGLIRISTSKNRQCLLHIHKHHQNRTVRPCVLNKVCL
jgi:hypothetical protein